MKVESIHCFCCYRRLKNYDPGGFQPSHGLSFVTHGHYGSTIFDPMDGSGLELALCDTCLKERSHLVMHVSKSASRIEYDYKEWRPDGEEMEREKDEPRQEKPAEANEKG